MVKAQQSLGSGFGTGSSAGAGVNVSFDLLTNPSGLA